MARKKIDITGQKFGRLTVIREALPEERKDKSRIVCWLCKCDCGNTHVARGTDLRAGLVKSCGCLKSKKQPKPENEFLQKMKKYEKVKAALCQEYDRKCLTRKCPLAKFGCYEFQTMAMMWNGLGVNGRTPAEKVIIHEAKNRGIEL